MNKELATDKTFCNLLPLLEGNFDYFVFAKIDFLDKLVARYSRIPNSFLQSEFEPQKQHFRPANKLQQTPTIGTTHTHKREKVFQSHGSNCSKETRDTTRCYEWKCQQRRQ